MVKKVTEKGMILYICEECGLKYRDREKAKECEKWCRQHGSCNLEIIKYAVETEEGSI